MLKIILSLGLISVISWLVATKVLKLNAQSFLTFKKHLPRILVGCLVGFVIIYSLLTFF